jgi:hypothetical protein
MSYKLEFEMTEKELADKALDKMLKHEDWLTRAGHMKSPSGLKDLVGTCEQSYNEMAWYYHFRDKINPELLFGWKVDNYFKRMKRRKLSFNGDLLEGFLTYPHHSVPIALSRHQVLTNEQIALIFNMHRSVQRNFDWWMIEEVIKNQRRLRKDKRFSGTLAKQLSESGKVRLDFVFRSDLPVIACDWPKSA